MEKPTGKVRKGKFSVPTKSRTTPQSTLDLDLDLDLVPSREDDCKKLRKKTLSTTSCEKAQDKDKINKKTKKSELPHKQVPNKSADKENSSEFKDETNDLPSALTDNECQEIFKNVLGESHGNSTFKSTPCSLQKDNSKNLKKKTASPNDIKLMKDKSEEEFDGNHEEECTDKLEGKCLNNPEKELIHDMLELEMDLNESKKIVTSKDKGRKLPQSLTDEEYEELFRRVLDNSEAKDGTTPEKVLKPRKMHSEGGKIGNASSKAVHEQVKDQTRKIKKAKKTVLHVVKQASPDIMKKDQKNKKHKPEKISAKLREDQSTSLRSEESMDEEGTWIQCTNKPCGKWRYVPDIHDPISVPEMWECSMNSDTLHKSCDDEQEFYDESEHILTNFTLGSLVWVKMDGFPWWPGMIECDPDYDLYFELPNEESMDPVTYHVTFFGKKVSRAWVRSSQISPYTKQTSGKLESSKNRLSNKWDRDSALKDAEKAFSMTLESRLHQFGFSRRFSVQSKTTNTVMQEDDSDNEIPDDLEESQICPKKKKRVSKKSSSKPMERPKQHTEKRQQRSKKGASRKGKSDLPSEMEDTYSDIYSSSEIAKLQPETANSPKEIAKMQPETANFPNEIANLQPEIADSPPEIADLPLRLNDLTPEISDSESSDQHVPDIMEVVQEDENINIEEDECDPVISQDKIRPVKHIEISKNRKKVVSKNSRDKNSPVKVSSHVSYVDKPDEQIDYKDGEELDVDFDDISEGNDNQNNRRFMGHCSDHDSNSDPLDLLEE